MPDTEPFADLERLAGQLHALTGSVASLQTSTDIDAFAASSAQLALLAARADLDAVLPGLPSPQPPAVADARALAARLRELGHALAGRSRNTSGDEAIACAEAAIHVDEAARRLATSSQ